MTFENFNIKEKDIVILGKLILSTDEELKIFDAIKAKQMYCEPSFATAEKLLKLIEENSKMFFVLCGTKKDIAKWANLLTSYGMNYGVNFVDFYFVKHFINKIQTITTKKLIVAYGNCQMHDYFDCLNRCSGFVRKYDSLYFKYEQYPRWEEEQVENLLCLADVFIITKESFDKKHRDLERFVKKNNPKCKIISIPCYSFRGVFPQTNPHIQEQNKFDIVQDIFNTFHREDIFINSMIDDEKCLDDIISQYNSGTTFTVNEIRKLFDLSLKQLEMMDRASAIKIARFVRENITRRRLFKDPVHMEDELVWHLTRQLLDILECEAPSDNVGGTIHYFSELPIYPEVAETLNLEWWSSKSRCELRLAEGMITVSPEEFIKRYCLFCENVYQIKRSLHITKEDNDKILEYFKV